MSRLEKRVERLEGGGGSGEVVALGHYPIGISEKRLDEIVQAKAREWGVEAPVSMHQLQCSGWPGGEADVYVWFIGTQADFKELFKRLMDQNAGTKP